MIVQDCEIVGKMNYYQLTVGLGRIMELYGDFLTSKMFLAEWFRVRTNFIKKIVLLALTLRCVLLFYETV